MKAAYWKEQLRARNIRLKKTRGQNFLVDERVAGRIVDLLHAGPGDVVLEIGPGMGVLTERLLEKARCVFAVEIEEAFCTALVEMFGSTGRLEVIPADILAVDLPPLWERLRMGLGEGGAIRIISNLPYYISTAVLSALLASRLPFARMVLTMQKEVAERIAAAPGGRQYGSLSVFTQYHCKSKLEFKIPGAAFFPAPEVASAVVSFMPWEKPPALVVNEQLFFDVVRASFSARRKTLRNSLAKFFAGLGLGRHKSEFLLEKCGVDGRRRAETLSMSEFARLANLVEQWKA